MDEAYSATGMGTNAHVYLGPWRMANNDLM